MGGGGGEERERGRGRKREREEREREGVGRKRENIACSWFSAGADYTGRFTLLPSMS